MGSRKRRREWGCRPRNREEEFSFSILFSYFQTTFKFEPNASSNKVLNILFNSNKSEKILVSFQKQFLQLFKFFYFLILFSFTSKPFLIYFRKHFECFQFASNPHNTKKQMHRHVYTSMLLLPIMNFNLMKNFIFLYFMSIKFQIKLF